jgi:ComF family protein
MERRSAGAGQRPWPALPLVPTLGKLAGAVCQTMTAGMALIQTLAPLIDLAFPPRCPLCGEGLLAQTGLCASCWNELVIPGEPSCSLCQRPFPEGLADGAICAPCLVEAPRHDGIAAGTLYNDASRRLVLSFKSGRRIALAPLMARLMAARMTVRMIGADSGWLLVPVPLHRWRLWRRGFNQSALLAGEIAMIKGMTLEVDALLRKKATPTLGGLGSKARARALSGAISVNPRAAERLKGANIVLVDDVLTSGATSGACVRTLKRAGAQRVVIACFARVLNEALPG